MTIELLIEEARTRKGTHEDSLMAARGRMRAFNARASKEWEAQKVTPELLNKVVSL